MQRPLHWLQDGKLRSQGGILLRVTQVSDVTLFTQPPDSLVHSNYSQGDVSSILHNLFDPED
jgi:hypothetical protein